MGRARRVYLRSRFVTSDPRGFAPRPSSPVGVLTVRRVTKPIRIPALYVGHNIEEKNSSYSRAPRQLACYEGISSHPLRGERSVVVSKEPGAVAAKERRETGGLHVPHYHGTVFGEMARHIVSNPGTQCLLANGSPSQTQCDWPL